MMRSMFAGVSGMKSHQQMMDVIGDNIANVNSSGFKSSRVVFETTLSQVIKNGSASGTAGGTNTQQVGLGVKLAATDAIMSQGATQSTGRASDLAIQGDGYFALQSGSGTVYTRAGSFGVDDSGQLVDPSGAVLLDTAGAAVKIPAGSRSFAIGPDGAVNVVDDQGVTSTSQSIGLTTFTNPAGLVKGGDGHLLASAAAGTAVVATPGTNAGSLAAGSLEMSNVDLAQEFTNMMIAQRGFQANSKVISTSDELLQELVNLKR